MGKEQNLERIPPHVPTAKEQGKRSAHKVFSQSVQPAVNVRVLEKSSLIHVKIAMAMEG
jgi:hypothetical protein